MGIQEKLAEAIAIVNCGFVTIALIRAPNRS